MGHGASKGNWWQRNWMWVVPVGCLGLIVLLVLFVAGIGVAVFSAMRSSDAYADAVSAARGDCELQQVIGAPIEPGWLPSGSIEVSGPSGEADISIPLSGPSGEAELFVVATKSAGEWSFDRLEAETSDGSERLDLLAPGRQRCD